MKVVPLPSALSKVTVPPKLSLIRLTTANVFLLLDFRAFFQFCFG